MGGSNKQYLGEKNGSETTPNDELIQAGEPMKVEHEVL